MDEGKIPCNIPSFKRRNTLKMLGLFNFEVRMSQCGCETKGDLQVPQRLLEN